MYSTARGCHIGARRARRVARAAAHTPRRRVRVKLAGGALALRDGRCAGPIRRRRAGEVGTTRARVVRVAAAAPAEVGVRGARAAGATSLA